MRNIRMDKPYPVGLLHFPYPIRLLGQAMLHTQLVHLP